MKKKLIDAIIDGAAFAIGIIIVCLFMLFSYWYLILR